MVPRATPPGAPKYLRRGKVKEVWELSPSELEFRFTNDISVFDKHIPSEIPHKGETLARTSAHWFELCSKLGLPHHFLELSGPTAMRVRRVRVVPKPRSLGPKPVDYLVPLEFIVRYYVAGSLWDRFKAGKIRPEAIGFPAGRAVQYGDVLPEPMFEVTTKLEPVDRPLEWPEALELAVLETAQKEEIREAILKIDAAMSREVEPRGLLHVDGKKEFAVDPSGQLMLVDTFGTADEDRFWDRGAFERGRFVEFSKEFVRQHYRTTGYFEQLQKARENGGEEPPIPALPPLLVDEVSRLYTTVFQRLTGTAFHPLAAPDGAGVSRPPA
ncbi:MAG: phosphoribosylaminoimidazolesuccinocarboxamide synthase [Thermoplasmata archaeon]|nr:phosphoribosylaminoimidazolesuccinocarboxamide synthase [Thermoplasmata archaeon]MCI4338086.1 phosphoribosylaminoimidazolesuccinocarboxamide synthase [Thermoplasmata archaeon]MCI4340895.1 phosphoribosylaminoimidazolesuccinocarboxamide synthase [Thermoplasmata archaeon]